MTDRERLRRLEECLIAQRDYAQRSYRAYHKGGKAVADLWFGRMDGLNEALVQIKQLREE